MKFIKILPYFFLTLSISLGATTIKIGVRPYYLVSTLENSPLKEKLSSCEDIKLHKTDFSISHRGAPLQFAEHSKESYEAAIKMGAGILECDVTFTKDKELVCRHSQCDLHTTTNILLTPLAKKCTQDFIPFDEQNKILASAQCCTSDITLQEFHTLKAKMDGYNEKALTREQYTNATPSFRTDLYANDGGTLMTHKESIALFKKHHLKMTPEIKQITQVHSSLSKHEFIDKLIQEYRDAQVDDEDIYIQSFDLDDLLYIIKKYPKLGENTIYLQENFSPNFTKDIIDLDALAKQGITTIAPPIWALLALDKDQNIIPSLYADALKKHHFKIITWSLEREEISTKKRNIWYYQSIKDGVRKNADILKILYVLDKELGVVGVFSDWPATVTFYKNCIDAKIKN